MSGILSNKELLRRLEGETPEEKLALYSALTRGPLAAKQIFLERTEVDVKVNFSDDVSSRIHFISPSLLTESGVSLLAVTILKELLDDSFERSDALCQSIMDSFYIHENEELSHDTILNARVTFVYLDCFGKLEEWFKFQTIYLSCMLLKQRELPSVPSYVTRPGFVCGGKFYLRMRQLNCKLSITQKTISWAGSLVGLKRGALPLRAEEVAASLEKHRSTLSKQGESVTGNPYRSPLDHIHETIEEIVEVIWKEPVTSLKERMPSGSSQYGWSRAEGGALGRISSLVREVYGALPTESKELAGYFERSPFAAKNVGGPIEFPLYVPTYTYTIADDILSGALKESLDCNVHVVLEPMKARIITSGPALRYQICRMIQKVVHGAMRRRHEYQLIGGPVDEDVLNKNFAHLDNRTRKWTFVSADYSAATDKLQSALSQRAIDLISERLGLDEETGLIYRQSMTNHILHYPEEFGGFVSEQMNGQLMGSPSSFPILCIVNMAALYAAYKRYNSRRGRDMDYSTMLKELRPLVNGDDLLFTAPDDFYELWSSYVAAAGLEKSPGKNYNSKDFVVINSTFFQLSWSDMGLKFNDFGLHARFSRVHWVGSGLLKGQARVLADTRRPKASGELESNVEANVDFGQLRSQLDWVLNWHEGAEEEQERSKTVWYRNMKEVLRAETRSWRLPVALGGLGLPLGGATRPQLVLANLIIKTWNTRLASSFTAKPKVGNSTTVAQLAAERHLAEQFGMRRYVKSELPWCLVKVPGGYSGEEIEYDPPTPEDLEGNIYADCFDRTKSIPRICTMQPHDLSVSPFVVGLTMLEQEEETRKRILNFDKQMQDAIKHFNGGPATLEEALKYSGTTCWSGAGTSHFLPNPRFRMPVGAARIGLSMMEDSKYWDDLWDEYEIDSEADADNGVVDNWERQWSEEVSLGQ